MFKRCTFLVISLLLVSISWSETTEEKVDSSLRKPRQHAISGEVGANTLASILGAIYTYYPNPQFGVDFGLGVLSTTGLRPGIRLRYNFSPKKFSPFISGGFKYGLGTGGTEIKTTITVNGETDELAVVVNKSPFLDGAFGFDYMAHSGFLLTATIGYSILLGGQNYEITEGIASEQSKKVLDLVYGSGLSLGVSFGKAF